MKPSSRRSVLVRLGLLGFSPLLGSGASSIFGCGYSPALGAGAGGLAVASAGSLVPEPLILRAALRGARERLAELGAFDLGSGAVLTLQILRLDELGAAARASGGRPRARGEELALRARCEVRERGELLLEREITRRRLVAAGAGLELDRDAALIRLGGDVGRALADAAVGLATPSEA